MFAVMVDGLFGRQQFGVGAEGSSTVWIAVVPREIAAGNLDPEPVAAQEHVAGNPEVDLETLDLSGFEQGGLGAALATARAEDTVTQIDGLASFPVKSVSSALEAANRISLTGPVTSRSRSSGVVV